MVLARPAEEGFGFLASCLVAGDPEFEKRLRRSKQRALALSMVLQFIRGGVKPRLSGRGYKPHFQTSGDFCCSTYWRRMPIGAPPQLAAKYDGDQRTSFQYFRSKSGRSSLSRRLETPFKLFTSEDTECFGG